jgi:Peptidase family M28
MEDGVERHVNVALEHLRHLTIDIGPRPSTQDGEERAAQYVVGVMRASGLRDVRCESFQSGRSTYLPYSMAVGAGLLGNLIYLVAPHSYTAFIAALLNGLGALGFFRQINFDDTWMRHLLPWHSSQNVIGVIPPRGECRHRAVLVAHLDSHRTPIFYSNPVWARIFSPLAAAVLASLAISSIAASWGLWAQGSHLEWVYRLASVLQASVLVLLIHAETTPYTVGANDNASGAATVLALGQRLAQEPLRHTEVWVANTGCEEVGAGGISALITAHGDALREAHFLNFDMVGIGSPGLLTREGVLKSYCPDPSLLDLARKVAAQSPGLIAGEHPGGAYTDMGVVIKRGFRGLVIDSIVPQDHPAKSRMGYWHQREDTYDKIERDCLAKAHRFGWAILQSIDQSALGNVRR